jgi:hypothetical protein
MTGTASPSASETPAGSAAPTATTKNDKKPAAQGAPAPPPTPRPAPGFWVYRRGQASGAYERPLSPAPVAAPPFNDTAARPGESWCYVVRRVVSTDPVIESAPSNEVCVALKDIFPPAAPTGVAVLVREGAAELSWSPSPEPDLFGYRVYRADGEQPPRKVADRSSEETSFRDEGLRAGAYHYTVTAVDRDGNESPPSPPAEARIP